MHQLHKKSLYLKNTVRNNDECCNSLAPAGFHGTPEPDFYIIIIINYYYNCIGLRFWIWIKYLSQKLAIILALITILHIFELALLCLIQ